MLRETVVWLAAAWSLGPVLFGCSDPAAQDAAPADGAPAVYGSSCAVCHGKGAEGVAGLGPELRHAPAAYATWVVRNGRVNTTMPAFPATTVSETQLGEIQTWLGAMPKPVSGQELYLDFCGNCHGPTGMGGPLLTSYITARARADLKTLVRAGAGSDPSMQFSYMPAEDVTQLSDAELELIATFLGAL